MTVFEFFTLYIISYISQLSVLIQITIECFMPLESVWREDSKKIFGTVRPFLVLLNMLTLHY